MRHHLAVALLFTALAACSTDVGSSADFSTDSFATPTHHGELDFHGTNTARFTESERFHGWSFTLTDSAKVTVGTVLRTPNLDTMMYVYQADANGKKTGANLAKNDNGGADGLASKLELELAGGSYFVQVKAKNVAMRGDIELAASCLGAGCPLDEPRTPASYCEGAHESIGKCMDEGATEGECAPSDSDALLCCNSFEDEEWFCDDLCVDGDLRIARVWGDDYDAVRDVFPEDDFSGLMDAYAFAVNQCASPDLDELARTIVDGNDLVEEETFALDAWIQRTDANFFHWVIDEDVVSVVDGIVGEKAAARFEATVEVPCPNCTDGYTLHGFFYPQVGKVVVLEQRWGGDS